MSSWPEAQYVIDQIYKRIDPTYIYDGDWDLSFNISTALVFSDYQGSNGFSAPYSLKDQQNINGRVIGPSNTISKITIKCRKGKVTTTVDEVSGGNMVGSSDTESGYNNVTPKEYPWFAVGRTTISNITFKPIFPS